MQAAKVVEVPLPSLMTRDPAIVFVLPVKGQFEVLVHTQSHVVHPATEAPANQLLRTLAIGNTSGDLLSPLDAIVARPSDYRLCIRPVGADRIRNALQLTHVVKKESPAQINGLAYRACLSDVDSHNNMRCPWVCHVRSRKRPGRLGS